MPSTSAHSSAARWALTTAIAFALTVVVHEYAHRAVGIAAFPLTRTEESLTALAGPVTSMLIVAFSVLWIAVRDPSRAASRWPIAFGLTAAVRIFMVWIVAGPFLLGAAPRARFDERSAGMGLGIPIVPLLLIETVLAAIGIAWLIRRFPSDERRAGLTGIGVAIVVVGIVVFIVDPRV